ncbi:hypothetical protein ES703_118862 [subsurface metagenome]
MIKSPRWPNTPLAKYPHLAGSDIPVWDAWIRIFGSHFRGFDYDHHTGVGLAPGKDQPYPLQIMWRDLTQKRIDVLGYRDFSLWVIEVKDRPTVACLGQVIGYTILLARDLDPCPPLVPCIVSRTIEPDIETCCRELHINFYDLSDGHGLLHDPFDTDIPLP